jgi:iron complex outermembrane receptor protein
MLLWCIALSWAEGPSGQVVEAPIQPPVLVNQASLTYPPQAGDQHGDVHVRVWIDEHGHVSKVEAVSGPEVFHEVAVRAGYELLWEPATQEGLAVPSSAIVSFHFAPPELPEDLPHEGHLEVLIEDRGQDDTSVQSRTTLEAEALEESAGQDLAGVVAQVSGVTLATGSGNLAKPIIRGSTERRLLLLHDGVRHASQKWGPDHAPELDPFSAGSISVVRGAAGARYGPDAIGGVLLVEPPPMRSEPGVASTMLGGFSSNGTRGHLAARVDGVAQAAPRLSMRAEGSFAEGQDLSAPGYVLANTASWVASGGGALQWTGDLHQLRLSASHFHQKAGVFYGVQADSPQAFQDQLSAAQPANAGLWEADWAIDRPYQGVSHDQVSLHSTSSLGHWSLQGVYAFQLNQRQEYEQVREAVEGPQYDFTLRTHSVDVLLAHEPTRLEHAWIEGGLGLQGSFQENVYSGYALLPNYRAFSGGVFGYQRVSNQRLSGELGLRMDGLFRAAYLDEQDYQRHQARGSLQDACSDAGERFRCPAAFQSVSASLGALLRVVPEHLDWKLDLSSTGRIPNADELYLIGAAPSFPVYALGDPDLGVERAWGATSTLGLTSHWVEAEVSGFGSLVQDYILFAPSIGESGPDYEVTIRGSWPVYAYQAVDARLLGADGRIDLLPQEIVGLTLGAATVLATELDSGRHLVGTPPDSGRVRLVLRAPTPGSIDRLEAHVESELVRKQHRVDPELDFAPAPAGYALWSAGLSAGLQLRGTPLRVGASGHNLLNSSYRSYNSLLRYYADAPGRDLRLRVGFDL